MISLELDRLIKNSISKNCSLIMEERFQNNSFSVTDVDENVETKAEEIIILTLSGHLFRVYVTLLFLKDGELLDLIQSGLNKSNADMDDEAFYDYIKEFGNVLCGSLKRDIQKEITSLGMSTPNLLNVECLNHIEGFSIDHRGGMEIRRDDNPIFIMQYYLKVYGQIDFDKVNQAKIAVDSGELEFF